MDNDDMCFFLRQMEEDDGKGYHSAGKGHLDVDIYT